MASTFVTELLEKSWKGKLDTACSASISLHRLLSWNILKTILLWGSCILYLEICAAPFYCRRQTFYTLFGHEKGHGRKLHVWLWRAVFWITSFPKVNHYNYEMKGILLLSLALPFRLSCREFKENQKCTLNFLQSFLMFSAPWQFPLGFRDEIDQVQVLGRHANLWRFLQLNLLALNWIGMKKKQFYARNFSELELGIRWSVSQHDALICQPHLGLLSWHIPTVVLEWDLPQLWAWCCRHRGWGRVH